MDHQPHAHDDSDPIALARDHGHSPVQVHRRAKERKSCEFSLSESGNVISDLDTDADIGLVARFGSRIQPKLRQDGSLVAESGRLPNLQDCSVQIRFGKWKGVPDQFQSRLCIIRNDYFHHIESEKDIGVIEHSQPRECAA
jgi:hypothetical protein